MWVQSFVLGGKRFFLEKYRKGVAGDAGTGKTKPRKQAHIKLSLTGAGGYNPARMGLAPGSANEMENGL